MFSEPGYENESYLTGINDSGVLCGSVFDSATGAGPGFVAYPVGNRQ
jgi:hypothetical protein